MQDLETELISEMRELDKDVIDCLIEKAENLMQNKELILSMKPKEFFDIFVPYSFVKKGLDTENHYIGALTVSKIFDSQISSQSNLDDPQYFIHILELILNEDKDFRNIELIKDYAEKTFLFKGFYPESFKVKPVAQTHFAKKAFCQVGTAYNFPGYFVIAENFDVYAESMTFLRETLNNEIVRKYEYLNFN